MYSVAKAYWLLSSGASGHPLKGKLYTKGGVFYDDEGPRMVQFWSDFPALRVFNDRPTEALQALDSGVKAGRHGMRVFYGLAENETDYGGFWSGAMVLPDLAKATLIPYMQQCKERGLKVQLTGGHKYAVEPQDEVAFVQWMAQAIKSANLADTVALFEWRNEYPLTSPWGDSDMTYTVGVQCMQIMRDALGCICTMGSPGEDDPTIIKSIEHSEVAGIDFGRDYTGDLLMKHAHRAYYDGRYHGYYKGRALWVTEPTGPNGNLPNGCADVYLPLEDPEWLYGLHAIYAVTGQACSYFNGTSVRHKCALDQTWGFHELPKLLAFMPETIGTWMGPTWFMNPLNMKEFVTVVAALWGVHDRPPSPIKTWTVQYFDGSTTSGSGPITLKPGTKAVIIKGEFV
jgi:hypothetical protein